MELHKENTMSHLTKYKCIKATSWVFNESRPNINKKAWNTKKCEKWEERDFMKAREESDTWNKKRNEGNNKE